MIRYGKSVSEIKEFWLNKVSLLGIQVTRLLQYLARLVSWYLLSRGRIESASRFEGLKTGLANGRKGESGL